MIALISKKEKNGLTLAYSIEYEYNTFSPGPGLEPGISVLDIRFEQVEKNGKEIDEISKSMQSLINSNFPSDEEAYFCAKEDYEKEIARSEDV